MHLNPKREDLHLITVAHTYKSAQILVARRPGGWARAGGRRTGRTAGRAGPARRLLRRQELRRSGWCCCARQEACAAAQAQAAAPALARGRDPSSDPGPAPPPARARGWDPRSGPASAVLPPRQAARRRCAPRQPASGPRRPRPRRSARRRPQAGYPPPCRRQHRRRSDRARRHRAGLRHLLNSWFCSTPSVRNVPRPQALPGCPPGGLSR